MTQTAANDLAFLERSQKSRLVPHIYRHQPCTDTTYFAVCCISDLTQQEADGAINFIKYSYVRDVFDSGAFKLASSAYPTVTSTYYALKVLEKFGKRDEVIDNLKKQEILNFINKPKNGGFGDRPYWEPTLESTIRAIEIYYVLGLEKETLPSITPPDAVNFLIDKVKLPQLYYYSLVVEFAEKFGLLDRAIIERTADILSKSEKDGVYIDLHYGEQTSHSPLAAFRLLRLLKRNGVSIKEPNYEGTLKDTLLRRCEPFGFSWGGSGSPQNIEATYNSKELLEHLHSSGAIDTETFEKLRIEISAFARSCKDPSGGFKGYAV